MVRVRRSEERGHANHGWLDTHHTFSFAGYYDPAHMGFRTLRVINDDRVAPGAGFPTHPHRSMEIISYVLEGALEHEDSMGNGSVIRPGEVQLMSAGAGVRHSEYNHDAASPVHFLQIWIVPSERGGQPRYQQRAFPAEERDGRWRLLVSPDGDEGSLVIKQDARLHGANLGPGDVLPVTVPAGRGAWLHVAKGELKLGGAKLGDVALRAGDAAAIEGVNELHLTGVEPAEVLVFDLA
jgi:redox-sensitive bicupin YhaK (pirin superfamily)